MEANGEGRTDGEAPSGKMTSGIIAAVGYVSLVLAIGVLFGTNLIPGWSRWYSNDQAFRRQTQVMQAGTLILATNAKAVTPGMVWASGGVQQDSGLGVAFWRFPFEVLAKVAVKGSGNGNEIFACAWAGNGATHIIAQTVCTTVLSPTGARQRPPSRSGLPHSSVRYGSIASRTSGAIGVVAL